MSTFTKASRLSKAKLGISVKGMARCSLDFPILLRPVVNLSKLTSRSIHDLCFIHASVDQDNACVLARSSRQLQK